MSWSKNNAAHRSTWAMVRYFHKNFVAQQGFVNFSQGGEWLNNFVISSAAGETAEMIADKSEVFATKLDEFFIGLFGASYENGQRDEGNARTIAIAAVAAALAVAGSRLKDIGDIVDAHYLFEGEIK